MAAAETGSAFVPLAGQDLDQIFSLQHERTVNRDNTVSFDRRLLQIEPVRWRGTLAGCRVLVHEHLDGSLSLTYGPRLVGRYDVEGKTLKEANPAGGGAVETTLRGKVEKQTFPPRLEIPQKPRDSHFSTATTAAIS